MDQQAHGHAGASGTAATDRPAGHGMVVVGTATMFFSHLPMFMSPHDYQVILEGTLSGEGADAQRAYREDRAKHPEASIYTFNPAAFVLTEIFPPSPQRTQFRGDLFRGHFERPPEFPGRPERIAGDVDVDITRVVYKQKLTPALIRPDTMEYLLFGTEDEMFLAHLITGAPDFDQILTTKVAGRQFTSPELHGGIRVHVTGTSDAASQRLKPGVKVPASAAIAGQKIAFELAPRAELYFMERELAAGDM